MFNKQITRSDAFLDMPRSTRLLYYDLSLDADDDGFLDKYKSIMRLTGASEDDLKLLVAKSFIIPFEEGIIVIKHWRMNNLIRSDRYKPTVYQEQKRKLLVKENGAYSLKQNEMVGIPNDNQTTTIGSQVVDAVKYSIGKVSIVKESIENSEQVASSSKRFVKPTIEEIKSYCEERKNGIDAEQFYNFYESKGWKVGNQSMKDWKSAIITWEKRQRNNTINTKPSKVADANKYKREE
jgi:hypothetical protein